MVKLLLLARVAAGMSSIRYVIGIVLILSVAVFAVPAVQTGIASSDTMSFAQQEGDTDTLTAGVDFTTMEINESDDSVSASINSNTQTEILSVNEGENTSVTVDGVQYNTELQDISQNGKTAEYEVSFNRLSESDTYPVFQMLAFILLVVVVMFMLGGIVNAVSNV